MGTPPFRIAAAPTDTSAGRSAVKRPGHAGNHTPPPLFPCYNETHQRTDRSATAPNWKSGVKNLQPGSSPGEPFQQLGIAGSLGRRKRPRLRSFLDHPSALRLFHASASPVRIFLRFTANVLLSFSSTLAQTCTLQNSAFGRTKKSLEAGGPDAGSSDYASPFSRLKGPYCQSHTVRRIGKTQH